MVSEMKYVYLLMITAAFVGTAIRNCNAEIRARRPNANTKQARTLETMVQAMNSELETKYGIILRPTPLKLTDVRRQLNKIIARIKKGPHPDVDTVLVNGKLEKGGQPFKDERSMIHAIHAIVNGETIPDDVDIRLMVAGYDAPKAGYTVSICPLVSLPTPNAKHSSRGFGLSGLQQNFRIRRMERNMSGLVMGPE